MLSTERSLSRRIRSGLTLVELIGGLTVTGLVLAVALRIFAVLSEAVGRADDATLRAEQYSNGMRWLAERLRESGEPNDSQPFTGLATSMSFRVQRTSDGTRSESERVDITVDSLNRWVAWRRGAPLVLRRNVDSVKIDYLGSRGLDARWRASWLSTSTRPLGVRIRLATSRLQRARVDTLLFGVGVRL